MASTPFASAGNARPRCCCSSFCKLRRLRQMPGCRQGSTRINCGRDCATNLMGLINATLAARRLTLLFSSAWTTIAILIEAVVRHLHLGMGVNRAKGDSGRLERG